MYKAWTEQHKTIHLCLASVQCVIHEELAVPAAHDGILAFRMEREAVHRTAGLNYTRESETNQPQQIPIESYKTQSTPAAQIVTVSL